MNKNLLINLKKNIKLLNIINLEILLIIIITDYLSMVKSLMKQIEIN